MMFYLPRWIARFSYAIIPLFRSRRKPNPPRAFLQLELLPGRILFRAGPLTALNLEILPPDVSLPAAVSWPVNWPKAGNNGAALQAPSANAGAQEGIDSPAQRPALRMALASPPYMSPEATGGGLHNLAADVSWLKTSSPDLAVIGDLPFHADYRQLVLDFRSGMELTDNSVAGRLDNENENFTRRPARPAAAVQASLPNSQGAISYDGTIGAVNPLLTGAMNGSRIADALDDGDAASAGALGMVEVNILDSDVDVVALVTAGWDLPETSQQLIPLGKPDRALVPAYVVGDEGAGAVVAPAEGREDLNLTSVVVGLDERTPAACGLFTRPADRPGCEAADQVFQEMALSEAAGVIPLSAARPSDAGARRLDRATPVGTSLGQTASQWGGVFAELTQSTSAQGKAVAALLAEAVLTFSVWRLINWETSQPDRWRNSSPCK